MLPILMVALLSIAIVPATVPARAQGAIAAFLPDPTRTDSLHKVPDNQGSWQSQQHLVGASNGYGDLAEPTQQSLGYGNNLGAPELHGQWLQVNILHAGATVAIRTLNFHLAENQITLQALEYPSSWQTFSPGLPVLSPELLAGRRVHWSGTDTFGIDSKAGDRAEASAEISTGPSAIGPDCVDTTVEEQIPGAGSATRVVSWCRGDQPGWAGLTQGGDGVIRAARPSNHAAVETTSRPAEPPRTLTGTIRKPTFYQVVNEIPFGKATAPSPVRIASAGRTLVIGDHEGRVTAWRESDLDEPGQSGYELA